MIESKCWERYHWEPMMPMNGPDSIDVRILRELQVQYKTALPLPEPPMSNSRLRKRRRAGSVVRTR